MHGEDKLQRVRFWLSEHGPLLGLVPAIATALLLAAALAPFVLSPTTPAVGRIEHEGYAESEEGGEPVAVVRVPEGQVTVSLPRATNCRVGDEIRLTRRKLPWAPHYAAAAAPCPGRG